jgi:hypothetical protein
MAIAFDAVTPATGASTVTFSHTCGAGADRAIYVLVVENFNSVVTGVTYGGVALTQLGSWNFSNTVTLSVWRLINPASGANNVVVSQSASHNLNITAISFTGVHQTTPDGTPVHATGNNTAPSLTVPSAANELVLDVLGALENTAGTVACTVGAGQTQRQNAQFQSGGQGTQSGVSTEPGAASVTSSWTLDNAANWNYAAVSIKPSGGADTTAPGFATVTATELAVGQAIQLNITMPTDGDLAQYEIRQLTGAYPANDRSNGTVIVAPSNTTPGATIQYTDQSLSNGTRYFYRVFCKDASGNWNAGTTVTEVAQLPPTVVGWYTLGGILKPAGDTGANPILEWTVAAGQVETGKDSLFHIRVGSDSPGPNLPPTLDVLDFYSSSGGGSFKYLSGGVFIDIPVTGVPWAAINAGGGATCRWYSNLNAIQDLYASVRAEQT